MAQALQQDIAPARGSAIDPELPWRVLSLLNVFRLLVPMLLLLVFFFDSPSTTVGSVHSGLFIGVTVAVHVTGSGSGEDGQAPWGRE